MSTRLIKLSKATVNEKVEIPFPFEAINKLGLFKKENHLESKEGARDLAKRGAEGQFVDPDSFFGYSSSHFKTLMR